jgi:hypothetical protein
LLDQKPPIDLGIEIETAEGAIFRLDADQLKAQDIPSGISFTTQRGDGFGTASFSLQREIFREWPDLNLLDTVRFVNRDASIAYEGLIQSFPRSSNPQTITVNCVGYMTSLKWRPMGALIIDRRLGGWGDPSTQRQANVLLGGATPDITAAAGFQFSGALGPGIVFTATNLLAGFQDRGEQWFYAGGQDIGEFRYDFFGHGEDAEWHSQASLSSDDLATSTDPGTDHHAAGSAVNGGVVATTSGRKYVNLAIAYSGTFTGAAAVQERWLNPAVVGTHGLTLHGTHPEEGYCLSDILQYLLSSFGSKLTWEGEENQFALTQCTWHDNPTMPYEAVQQLNNYVLWETNVWEERKFYFEPADLTKADWQIRTSDPGVTVNFQGDSIESFANGVVITYSDFFGHTYTLYPDEHAELQDENENNPAARHGEDIWLSYTIPWQCLEGEALQFGRAYLAQSNRPKRPGSFTVTGHIQDAAGHWRRASDVRCSQTIAVMDDLYEGEPRLVTATSYDGESATASITVDAPPMTIESLIARQQNALEARNLT